VVSQVFKLFWLKPTRKLKKSALNIYFKNLTKSVVKDRIKKIETGAKNLYILIEVRSAPFVRNKLEREVKKSDALVGRV
jgi:hypothetical protein